MYKRRGIHVTIFSQFLISSNYVFNFSLLAFSLAASPLLLSDSELS